MNDGLETLTTPDLSATFAKEVLGWSSMEVKGEHDETWLMWHNAEQRMTKAPQFAKSVDLLMPFLLQMAWHSVNGNSNQNWEVRCSITKTSRVAHSTDSNDLARAICIALIRVHRDKKKA